MHDGRTDRPDLAVETPPVQPVATPRARVIGLIAAGVSGASLIAAGADAVEPDPIGVSPERLDDESTGSAHVQLGSGMAGEATVGRVVVEDAAAAAAALLAGATVLHTHDPRPVRRAADIIALLRAVRG
jgi:hypothetical protein